MNTVSSIPVSAFDLVQLAVRRYSRRSHRLAAGVPCACGEQVNLEKAQFTKDEISAARAAYKPIAKRGSILYFAVSGLAALVSM